MDGALGRMIVGLMAGALALAACGSETGTGIAESGAGTSVAAAGADQTTPNTPDGAATSTTIAADPAAADSPTPASDGTLAASSIDGIFLDAVVIQREGPSVTVRFTLSSTREKAFTWSYELASVSAASQLALPTGMTLIDTAAETQLLVLAPEDGGCVCSRLGPIESSNPVEYFATFDAPSTGDFELYIPTFPLMSVRGDSVVPPRPLVETGLAPATTDGEGRVLDAVSARRVGPWVAVEFLVSNPADDDLNWSYELSAASAASQLGHPTGVTLFDPSTQAIANPIVMEERPCLCSRLSELEAQGSASYFAFVEGIDAATGNVTIPGFPQIASVPINPD